MVDISKCGKTIKKIHPHSFIPGVSTTVKSMESSPSHFPAAYLVFFVQDFWFEQMGNVQFLQPGDSPKRTLANVDFPVPVWPTTTIFGSGRSTDAANGNAKKSAKVIALLILVKIPFSLKLLRG